MTTFTTDDRIYAEKDGSYTVNVEPIPFAGMVTLNDYEDREQMLREQLGILQAECQRLRKKLMDAGIHD